VISDHLAASVERHGGKILLMARVDRIVVEEGRVKGIELESKQIGRCFVRAPAVISNADLKHTLLDMLAADDLEAETTSRTEAYEMAPALGMVYLGYQRDLRAEHHPRTNYWVYPDYDYEPQYREVAAGRFPADPFAYISIASLKDPTNPRLAPEGVTNLQVMSLAPHQPEAWGVTAEAVTTGSYRKDDQYLQAKGEYTERLIQSASRVFSDLGEKTVFQELATPLTHSRYTRSTSGTSYGIAATPQQFLRRRPGIRTEVEGLYLCGASTRMGHGIGGVTLSGLFAAAAIAGRGLVKETFENTYSMVSSSTSSSA